MHMKIYMHLKMWLLTSLSPDQVALSLRFVKMLGGSYVKNAPNTVARPQNEKTVHLEILIPTQIHKYSINLYIK